MYVILQNGFESESDRPEIQFWQKVIYFHLSAEHYLVHSRWELMERCVKLYVIDFISLQR
jgi:hypothetical protein